MRRGLVFAALAALALPLAAPAAKTPTAYDPELQTFSFATGARAGTALSGSSLVLVASGLTPFAYTDPHGSGEGTGTYDSGTWTSEWRATATPFRQAVASWIADTPAGTWVQTEFQARTADLRETKWYVLGRWAYGDADFHRTSLSGQGDADGFVAIDTFVAAKKASAFSAYRTRLTLLRRAGSTATPRVDRLSVVASDPSASSWTIASPTTMTSRALLAVPEYSQEVHIDDYPQFDSGGQAWCSPTATSMVLGYWRDTVGTGFPTPADYGYVYGDLGAGHPDPWVDYAARYVYDYNYDGAGNWPFNVAYAGHFGLTGAVTQLRSLAEAEEFVKRGIPLVISIAFGSGKLDGAPIKSTDGHLMVIVGFEANGDPIVNDPAAHPAENEVVQHVYGRAQFERAWQEATAGIVYLIHPAGWTLPPSRGNW